MSIQQQIVRGIGSLLHQHDYLVLPDFGGFVLKSGPAHLSSSGLQLHPPFKTLSFNSRLRQNDSILATWLQEQLNCSPHEALGHLRDFSAYCHALLQSRRRLNLEGIGFFFLDFEGNIGFEPQADVNFLTDSFGFGPVHLTPLQPIHEVKEPKLFEDRAIVMPATATQVRRRIPMRRVVIPALGAMALFGLLLMFVSNNRISGQIKASLFGDAQPANYYPLSYPELSLPNVSGSPLAYVADANGIATVELDSKLIAVKAIEASAVYPATSIRNSSRSLAPGNFEIVLGCFTVSQNAERLAAHISGKNGLATRVSERNEKGMFVVSMGAYATKLEATEALVSLKQMFPKAWIK